MTRSLRMVFVAYGLAALTGAAVAAAGFGAVAGLAVAWIGGAVAALAAAAWVAARSPAENPVPRPRADDAAALAEALRRWEADRAADAAPAGRRGAAIDSSAPDR